MSSNDHWFDRHFHRPVGWAMKVHTARKFYNYARKYLTSSNKKTASAMLTPTSTRKRGRSQTRSHGTHKHRRSMSTPRRSNVAQGSTLYTPGVKHGRKRLSNVVGPDARVHVSSALVKKIHKVMDDDDIQGTYQSIFYGDTMNVQGTPNENSFWNGFTQHFTNSTDGHAGFVGKSPWASNWSFTCGHFLDAAAILFNGKTPSNVPDVALNPISSGSFDFNDTAFTIKSATTTYNLKNNSPITVNITIYLCAPKKPSSHNFKNPIGPLQITNMIDDQGAQNLIVANALRTPLVQLGNAQVVDTRDERIFLNAAQEFHVESVLTYEQFGHAGMGVSPQMFKTFTDAFSIEKTVVALQPGQTYKYVLQGPKEFDFKSSKYFKDSAWQPLQKFSRFPFLAINQEMSNIVAETAGGGVFDAYSMRNHVLPTNAHFSHNINVERQDTIRITMPDQAGGLTSITPGSAGNTLRKRRPFLVNAAWAYQPAITESTFVIENANPGSYNDGT